MGGAVIWAMVGLAWAQPHPLLPTLAEWADRAVAEYTLEGFRPYRATVALVDEESWFVEANLGAVVVDQGWRTRPGRVEVVVGDPGMDSSRWHQRSGDTVGRPRFVVDDVPIAVSRDLWLATDQSFKEAVGQLEVKRAALARVAGAFPPDWSAEIPVVTTADRDRGAGRDEVAPSRDLDVARLRDIAVRGSDRLRALGGLRSGEVKARARVGTYVLATSEGTRLVQPEDEAVVYAWADVLRDDGVHVVEAKQWVAATVGELPPADVLLTEIEALGQRVLARSHAEVVTYYEGPVVFEGDAAADLFRYLMVPEVLGTPPEPRSGRTYAQLMREEARIGRRLLDDGWSVADDPPYHHDREGVPAQRVELVRDGVVRDLLMSRVPRHDRATSNGHARGDVQGRWVARESVITVHPDRLLSDPRFEREVDQAMRAADLDRVLVVRGLERGRGRTLPNPTDMVWRYADGREAPGLTLDFTLDDRRVLRDVVAAGGGMRTRTYLAPHDSGGLAQGYSGLPAAIVAPGRVLVGEMEAVFPGGTLEPPVLAAPPL